VAPEIDKTCTPTRRNCHII